MMIRQHLRYAVRMLLKRPLFTIAAVATLALGIGLNAAVFSAVHALLLRPLDGVRAPDELVQVYRTWGNDFLYGSSSVPHYQDLRDRNEVLSGLAAWQFIPISLSADGRSELTMAQIASANLFSVLGVEMELGRGFLPEEAKGPGGHPVVVISSAFWESRFGRDPGVVGRVLTINGRPFTVVGVAAGGFKGPLPAAAPVLWAPLMMQRELMPEVDRLEARGSNWLNVVGRLRPGVSVDAARANLDLVQQQLAEQYPDSYERSGLLVVPQSEAGIHPMFRNAQVGLSTVMMVVVGLLLLIACVNVANLFLVRARERRHEIGLRLSLGAGRRQILTQLLTESVLFSLIAGAVGIGLAAWAIRLANGIEAPGPFPIRFDFQLDWPVLLFALGASVLTGLLFGLAPALQAAGTNLVSSLKGESTGDPARRSRLVNALVVVQMALSLVLLVSAGVFVQNLRLATEIDKGFESDNLLLASVDLGLQGYDQPAAETFFREAGERLAAIPGVVSVATAESVPLGFSSQQNGVAVPGYEPREGEMMSLDYNQVGVGYFETAGVRLLEGRTFRDSDTADSAPVLIVNRTMAERFWPGESPLGKIVRTTGAEREVIGVVADGRYRSLGEEPLSYMYLPLRQVFSMAETFHLRTAADPEQLAPQVRAVIAELDPDLPVYDLQSMNRHLGIALLPARLGGAALGLFGILGLVLAAVGIYGVMAYSVAQRTREIGIRIAIGADHSSLVGMVLRRGGLLTALGIAIGLAAAAAAASLVSSLLYSASAFDPVTFVGVPLALAAIALLATYLPARRAAAVDPIRALRAE